MSGVAAVIPVGPGDKALIRTARVTASLARHDPGVERLVLLIDGVSEADVRPHVHPGPIPVQYLVNPRNGRGVPVHDGLACGLTLAFAVIAAELPGRHVWKIDTDALVLRPCVAQITTFLEQCPKVGMCGTYELNPGGESRYRDIVPGIDVARKFMLPAWYWRTNRKFRTRLFGRNRLYARWMREAHAKGLPWGWHVQGGSYAISAAALAHWHATGRLADPEIWLGAVMSEDVGFSHWAILDGFTLAGFNHPGEPFGVSAIGLPMPPADLVRLGYGVAHSLKVGDWDAEAAVYHEFIRLTGGTPV